MSGHGPPGPGPGQGGCSICRKQGHRTIECPLRKGCGKCKRPTQHCAQDCPQPYPRYDEQVCDACLKPGHEVKDNKHCVFPSLDYCKICGHGDHQKKVCPLLKSQNIQAAMDQMTPSFREKQMKTLAKAKPASTFESPAKPPPVKTQPVLPRTSPPKSTSNSPPRTVLSPIRDVTDKMKDLRLSAKEIAANQKLEKQKLYDNAELEITKPPPRGEISRPSKLMKANFYQIEINPKVVLHRYSITLGTNQRVRDGVQQEVAITNRDRKRELIQLLLHNASSRPRPLHNKWASDYNSTIISVGELFKDSAKTPQMVTAVVHPRSERPGGQAGTMTSRVNYLGIVETDLLKQHANTVNHVKGKPPLVNSGGFHYHPDDDLKALNIISWKEINAPGFNGGRHGAKFYPSELAANENVAQHNRNLYMIRDGFFTSMRPGQESVLLNVNVVTSAFYSPIRLQKWIDLYWSFGLPPRDLNVKLRGVKVIFDVGNKEHRKGHTVLEIGPKNVSQQRFPLKDEHGKETETTVFAYMRTKYGRTDPEFEPHAWCINVGNSSRPTWFPADKLTIVDWQVVTSTLDEVHNATMVLAAEKRPQACKNLIRSSALPRLGIAQPMRFYNDFGIAPTNRMIEIHQKILPAVLIELRAMGQSSKAHNQSDVSNNNAAWNFQRNLILKGAMSPGVLHVISFGGKVDVRPLYDALLLHRVIERTKNNESTRNVFGDETTFPEAERNRATFRQSCIKVLDEALRKLTPHKRKPPVILIILPGDKPDRQLYPEVKRWGDCLVGIPTVCVRKSKLVGANSGLLANICLKINFKLRGVSHELVRNPTDRYSPSGTKWNTMIVGADVTHPAKGSEGCPSIAAIVATNDDMSSHYLGSARLQKSKDECIHDLTGMMMERLLAWHEKAKRVANPEVQKLLPDQVLFYRDGVSESQYGMVLYEELPQIVRGCQLALKNLRANLANHIPATWKEPDITLIVVTKRHHARFSQSQDVTLTQKDWEDKKIDFNLKCGTVADTRVVTPNHFSFYLQSHHSPLGSARNSHYVVLRDDMNYPADQLQNITNRICFTGARATKGLSICTPARYADFLCDRMRNYLNPALNGLHLVTPSSGPHRDEKGRRIAAPPSDYENDRALWNTTSTVGGRKNPWHPALDDIMFYL